MFADHESDKAIALKEQADKHAEELARLHAMNDKMAGALSELIDNSCPLDHDESFCVRDRARKALAEYEAMKTPAPSTPTNAVQPSPLTIEIKEELFANVEKRKDAIIFWRNRVEKICITKSGHWFITPSTSPQVILMPEQSAEIHRVELALRWTGVEK
jgi:hypothetical protein